MSGIRYFSEVLNQKGAPALYEDTIANIPAATFEGRIFVATDVTSGDTIFRDNGNGSWSALAGNGGGGTFINGVTDLIGGVGLGGYLTQDTEIGLNSLSFKLTNNGDNLLFDTVNDLYYFGKGNALDTGVGIHITGDTIYTQYCTQIKGILLDFANTSYKFGDYNFANNGTSLIINDDTQTIYTKWLNNENGISIYFPGYRFKFGDYNSQSNGTFIDIFDGNQTVSVYNNGSQVGIYLDFVNYQYQFGDFNATNHQTSIKIYDENYLILFNTSFGFYQFNNVPTYANQAAAIAGGLGVGYIYQHNDHSLHIVA